MRKFIEEFKEFALRGNVMDMAVGVIIGGAFSGIVTSLTDNFINPILKFLTAGARYSLHDIGGFASNFLSTVVNFVIMATSCDLLCHVQIHESNIAVYFNLYFLHFILCQIKIAHFYFPL